MSGRLKALCALVLVASCARKMVPPSPDRFPPGLTSIEVQDRSHVVLGFNEPIDTLALTPGNFRIAADSTDSGSTARPGSPQAELAAGLPIRFVAYGLDPSQLVLTTAPQSAVRYRLSGLVADTAGNQRPIRRTFVGNSKPDTLRPRVLHVRPAAGTTGIGRAVSVGVSFSEPIDTTRARYFILPRGRAPEFRATWASNQAALSFARSDTLPLDSAVYYFAFVQSPDLEHNALLNPSVTFFARDTIPLPVLLSGTVTSGKKPLAGALVIALSPDSVTGCGVSDYFGQFTFRVREMPGEVLAVADTSGDGLVDLEARRPGQEAILFELVPGATPRPFDDYLH